MVDDPVFHGPGVDVGHGKSTSRLKNTEGFVDHPLFLLNVWVGELVADVVKLAGLKREPGSVRVDPGDAGGSFFCLLEHAGEEVQTDHVCIY